jgi:leucyl-tRNA synthetase
LHLLYSRFWHKFLNDIEVAPGKEPYATRRQHGVILGEDGQRMSKSRGNVVNPEEIIDKFGVDTLRIYLLFMGPYDATMPWNTKGVEGAYRFLSRVWRLYQTKDKIAKETSPKLKAELHRTIKKVSEDIESLKHNTAIAALMEFLNVWSGATNQRLSRADAGAYLKLLAPFAPYLAEELCSQLDSQVNSIHSQSWPKYDPKLVKEEKVTVIVQVNGKVRGQVEVQSAKSKVQNEVREKAKQEPNVAKHLQGKKIRKAIFVPGRLINFVV